MKSIVCECERPTPQVEDAEGQRVVTCFDCGREIVSDQVAQVVRIVQVAVAQGLDLDVLRERLDERERSPDPAPGAPSPDPEPWIGPREAAKVTGRSPQFMRDNFRAFGGERPGGGERPRYWFLRSRIEAAMRGELRAGAKVQPVRYRDTEAPQPTRPRRRQSPVKLLEVKE